MSSSHPPSQRPAQILVIDDEPDLRTLYELTLLREGYRVEAAGSVSEAWQHLEATRFDAVITDMRLPDGQGMEIIQRIQKNQRSERCVVMTAYGSAENAVEALKAGAFDYLTKPVDLKQFRAVVASAVQAQQQQPVAQAALRSAKAADAGDGASALAAAGSAGASALERLVGDSEPMRLVKSRIAKVARGMAPVLVRGESGTGKELVARAVHACSQRSEGPFVAVNCGAIPENLLEAEFFGARKGSYTGSAQDRDGYFQAARGGTLFLDEIGDLPKYQQVKLLRVLEDGAVTRLGATSPIRVDFRLVAATNRNLRKMVASGEFRADLFYRLAVIELHVPSLEERGEIDKIAIFKALLANVLGDQLEALGETPHWLSDAVAETYFPGNVRQLRNLAERVGVIARQLHSWDQHLIQRAIALTRGTPSTGAGGGMGLGANAVGTSSAFDAAGGDQRKGWNGSERNRIIAALEINDWKRQDTAQHLGISRKVLWEKMRKYQILDGEPGIPEDA